MFFLKHGVVEKPELNYTHAHKSLWIASPKELVLFLGKVNLHTKFDYRKSDNKWESYHGHKP